PCYLRDWEMQVHFKIHGQGKKNLNGDGFAIWYTKDRMQQGPVFGSKDNFLGLGVFVDTYPNEEKQQEVSWGAMCTLLGAAWAAWHRAQLAASERVFPYISAMVNNGSLTYDHDRDGRPTELGGCTAMVRNLNHDTFLVIRYVKRRLTVLIDIDGKQEWRDCIDVPGVRLPRGYYFGTSSVTGDLSAGTTQNSDSISRPCRRAVMLGQIWELSVAFSPQRVFPYISAMVNNGSLTYDHDRDGRPTELGGCTAMVRNLNHDTFLVIRYVKRRLTVLIDIDGKQEWRDCIDVPGVRLPRGYYFGTSSVTGDLSDNHDIISLKLYQLTVERTPEEERRDKEVYLPVVDNLKLPGSKWGI
ncbi:hypothetical protein CIB84_014474, partial [Bambusicola thoracicus]